jgi:hypothetical protein
MDTIIVDKYKHKIEIFKVLPIMSNIMFVFRILKNEYVTIVNGNYGFLVM